MIFKSMPAPIPDWEIRVVQEHRGTATQWHYDQEAELREAQKRAATNLGFDMVNLAAAYGVTSEELYRFLVEFLRTDGDNKLLTWRAARRITG